MTELSIIIVNWNSKEYLRKCLTSIRAQPGGASHEIVVIDAASHDGADQMLADEFPDVRFCQATQNLGFARANNVAFAASTGRFLLFLNPDTEVVGSAVAEMLEQLRALPRAAAIGCKLLNSDGTLQTSCIQAFPTILNQVFDSEFLRGRWPKSTLWGMAPLFQQGLQPSAVDAISGACLMLSRDAFERVGHFSEDYFMYAEDMDLCFKLREAGYQNYYVPTATVVHHGAGSSDRAPSDFATVMTVESMWRFFRKSRGFVYASTYRCAMFFAALSRLFLLGMAWPIIGLRGTTRSSFKKWLTICRWSLGCEGPGKESRAAELC